MLEFGTPLEQYLYTAVETEQTSEELAGIIYQISLTGGELSQAIAIAALRNLIGHNGDINIQGEEQKHLDIYANDHIKDAMAKTPAVCAVATEEEQHIHLYENFQERGEYLVCFDPLDGSSNSDVNVSVGTIFSIMRRPNLSNGTTCSTEDFLQLGENLVSSGYILYGTSTMLVFSHGEGVVGFTFDPNNPKFYLTHPNIQTPKIGKYYSVNESYSPTWEDNMWQYVEDLKTQDNAGEKPKSSRYIGSLVADIHRNMLEGGIFMYPADTKHPNGKLRILFEAFPMAFLAEQAGGTATDGKKRILELMPDNIHARTPLYIGSLTDVNEITKRMTT